MPLEFAAGSGEEQRLDPAITIGGATFDQPVLAAAEEMTAMLMMVSLSCLLSMRRFAGKSGYVFSSLCLNARFLQEA